MHVWPLYGSVLGAVTLRSFLATDRALRSAAIVLSADWFASNALRFLDAFDYRLLFRDSDLALCVGFLLAWAILRKPWMAVLAALYAISGLVGWVAYAPGSKYSFDLALNAAFLARLAVVWITSSEPRKIQEIT